MICIRYVLWYRNLRCRLKIHCRWEFFNWGFNAFDGMGGIDTRYRMCTHCKKMQPLEWPWRGMKVLEDRW